jgi:hypothetical protein
MVNKEGQVVSVLLLDPRLVPVNLVGHGHKVQQVVAAVVQVVLQHLEIQVTPVLLVMQVLVVIQALMVLVQQLAQLVNQVFQVMLVLQVTKVLMVIQVLVELVLNQV